MCGGLFGGGGGPAPLEVQKVNPTPTQITPASVETQATMSNERSKRRRAQGFSSTQLDDANQSVGKTTLG